MKKIFFVFLLIFSLLIISGKGYRCEAKEDSFNKLEGYILDKYEFVESGMKLEYTVKSSIKDEYERIDNIFNNKSNLVISNSEKCISAKSENINYSVNMYKYGDVTKIEVILINKNSSISNINLKLLLQEIRNDNFVDERYFSFIKGKINTKEKNIFDDIEKELQVEINEILDVNNGYIAKATMKDKSDINIGQIDYDTGSYLIIGTPIIFVTY
ncbi:hypothetical protein ABFP60_17840 [Clostridioides difficile]